MGQFRGSNFGPAKQIAILLISGSRYKMQTQSVSLLLECSCCTRLHIREKIVSFGYNSVEALITLLAERQTYQSEKAQMVRRAAEAYL